MSSSKLKVGYFGIPGSFTYKTARTHFAKNADFVSTPTFREIFSRVQHGDVDFGVVPIENTLAGSIYENYDLLVEFDVFVVGEVSARVSHCLLVAKEVADSGTPKEVVAKLRKVYSHEKALEQCSNFFKQNTWIKPVAYTNTADAAKLVADKKDPTLGAIADRDNTKLYNLKAVLTEIENNKYNFTRFLIIKKNRQTEKDVNKCSLLVHLPHVTGSLSHALELLTKYGCNLTKIESRPVRTQPFDYVFYLDFIFEGQQKNLDKILVKLKDVVEDYKVLGVYKVDLLPHNN